jgi:hypothetical protein
VARARAGTASWTKGPKEDAAAQTKRAARAPARRGVLRLVNHQGGRLEAVSSREARRAACGDNLSARRSAGALQTRTPSVYAHAVFGSGFHTRAFELGGCL